MKRLFLYTLLFVTFCIQAQNMKLPYDEIPEYPENYDSGNIMTRMIDGLGFRYYWATEGLTQKDLDYKPSKESRSVLETLQHICSMSEMILNAPQAKPNIQKDFTVYSYDELRKMTLENLKGASNLMAGKQAKDFEDFQVIFQQGEKQTPFPYWNLINGMLSDCIYHAGQITMMRRVSGNPINPNISVFTGKVRK